jgi:tetratricopeptide (TPR) repeat protein
LKDLYRCRRHVDREEYVAAIESGERFLATLRKHPWRARLIYLTWSLYTWNVEAMTRNNIGAAEMMRGRFAAAREQFDAALALDSGYALPYANLAIMASVEGDHTESERLMALAQRNGYAEKAVDRLVARAGAAYAGVQGRPLNP